MASTPVHSKWDIVATHMIPVSKISGYMFLLQTPNMMSICLSCSMAARARFGYHSYLHSVAGLGHPQTCLFGVVDDAVYSFFNIVSYATLSIRRSGFRTHASHSFQSAVNNSGDDPSRRAKTTPNIFSRVLGIPLSTSSCMSDASPTHCHHGNM